MFVSVLGYATQQACLFTHRMNGDSTEYGKWQFMTREGTECYKGHPQCLLDERRFAAPLNFNALFQYPAIHKPIVFDYGFFRNAARNLADGGIHR